MIKTSLINPMYPILPLGNVPGVAYSDKETLFNFIASLAYLTLIHLVMRLAVKKVPEYKKENKKEMIVCHIITAGVSLAMLLLFGLSDMLIKGTVFHLILLYSSLSDNHTRTLNDAASVMVVITSFIGADVSDIPKMVLSALVLFGVLLIFAVATNGGLGGAVVMASYDADGYGFYVKLKHDDTYSTIYGHCSALLVSAGQTVKQGQIIAKVGSTGYSTGNHLHFEVIQNGVRVDALSFFE